MDGGPAVTACILAHPEPQGFRRLALLTRDAQSLYGKAGFSVGPAPLTHMERRGALSAE